MAINPRNLILPSMMRACPAMGVLQFPSKASKKARSQLTQTCVSIWFRALMYLRARSSPSRHWTPMAPCATAGSISSQSRTAVAYLSMSIRFNPAMANSVASTTPSFNFRRRVWTFPRKLTHFKVGFWARIWACRRKEAVPMTDPSGRSAMVAYLLSFVMKASLVSSRGKLQGRTVPSGNQVGTSFIEWTQMSTSSPRRATSSSLVKRPFPPNSMRDLSRIISP
mmetsp:Transcript_1388/g.2920  ORF Transcript_1388/g.2920 Transcript_1388/m.2920 type:complete len:224 (+) Transcript_1388:261-932(+)